MKNFKHSLMENNFSAEDIKKVIHYAQLILELKYGIKKTKEK